MKIKASARAWIVRYTRPHNMGLPGGEEKIWQYNYCSVVIADTACFAFTETLQAYPDATILSVNPGPIGQVIVQADAVED